MVALIGDAEMDEGNIFEALLEGWKHGLRNTWWIVDYNRQSLDAVVREGLWSKFEAMFRNFGWDVVVLRHGRLQEAAFAEPGGATLKAWIEACPNQLYSALTFQGGAAWRKRLHDELGDQGDVSALIDRRSDEQLAALMGDLGGHDLECLLDAFAAAAKHDRPVCFIAYTIKGFGLPLAGHKDNHAGLMTPSQVELLRKTMGIRPDHEWDPFEGLATPEAILRSTLAAVPFAQGGERRFATPVIPVPDELTVDAKARASTQAGFGLLLHEIAKSESELARRIVTTSPDVTVVNQSRRMGQSPRALRARRDGRRVSTRAHSLDVQLGFLAEGTASRTRHRRDEPVHHVIRARLVALAVRRAIDSHRYLV